MESVLDKMSEMSTPKFCWPLGRLQLTERSVVKLSWMLVGVAARWRGSLTVLETTVSLDMTYSKYIFFGGEKHINYEFVCIIGPLLDDGLK